MTSPAKSRAALMRAFNEKIHQVASIVEAGSRGDPVVTQNLRRVRLLLGELPYAALDIAGPYLLKYAAEINLLAEATPEGDAWFLDKDFKEDLAASKDPDRQRDTAELIPRLRRFAQETPFAERGPIREVVVDLLDIYVDYRRLILSAGGEAR